MATIGDRLASERRRIGMNQTVFAKETGVGRASQVNYETDRRSPDSEYWEKAAMLGVDVQYVITGVRSDNLATVAADEKGRYNTNRGAGAMNRDEQRDWFDALDQLTPEARARLRAVVDSMASAARPKKPTG